MKTITKINKHILRDQSIYNGFADLEVIDSAELHDRIAKALDAYIMYRNQKKSQSTIDHLSSCHASFEVYGRVICITCIESQRFWSSDDLDMARPKSNIYLTDGHVALVVFISEHSGHLVCPGVCSAMA